MREQRDAGMAVLRISTELNDILAQSDRIAIMYGGEIVSIIDAADVDLYQLGLMMGGEKLA